MELFVLQKRTIPRPAKTSSTASSRGGALRRRSSSHWTVVLAGVSLWGVHMGMTQGLLATMVADTAPADLRGTAFGFFNLVSGVAMLIASVLAGWLWDSMGAEATFYAGALFCVIALAGLLRQPPAQAAKSVR